MRQLLGLFFNRHDITRAPREKIRNSKSEIRKVSNFDIRASNFLVRSVSSVCLLVDDFSFYFTPLTGVLFTFPSRYLFTIGGRKYLALASGLARFPQAFSFPVVLRIFRRKIKDFSYGAVTLFGRPFQSILLPSIFVMQVLQPPDLRRGLGCSHFARRYLGNQRFHKADPTFNRTVLMEPALARLLFLFLQLLRCFTSLSSFT